MLCRSMHVDDIPAVVAIEKQVQFHPWTAAQFLDSVQNHQCTVIELDHQIKGFCIMQPVLDEANLLLMAIEPNQQGKGLGFVMLEHAIQSLSEKCIQIFLEVRESNQAAIALYEKSGFHQIDVRRNYYPLPQGKKEHAVIMVNLLHPENFSFQ